MAFNIATDFVDAVEMCLNIGIYNLKHSEIHVNETFNLFLMVLN